MEASKWRMKIIQEVKPSPTDTTEQVLNYRKREHERAAAAVIERDIRQRSRKIKITQAVERLVEDMIQESMARGDFRNLSGADKPLNKFEYNPYADPMTHNLNRILFDNGREKKIQRSNKPQNTKQGLLCWMRNFLRLKY
ncbi:DnaJ like subfamily C member 28 [Dissostichus eleginoides]|uniref:DnaJ like subfamily C member 28 n=1 Tax=Dissostichus eleginoides TaxID=100907 RepID=A0AAD9C739_DISEL|nr:DnaJ like subfamily C member 28 [Dissostichus eleginoides]